MANENGTAVADKNYTARAKAEIDPLLFYESQVAGKEFIAYVPAGDERRFNEARRDELIVKTWRGVPADKSVLTRKGASKMRNIEAQRIIDSERLFLIVLAAMTLLLGTIFAYFVMNFVF